MGTGVGTGLVAGQGTGRDERPFTRGAKSPYSEHLREQATLIVTHTLGWARGVQKFKNRLKKPSIISSF